MVATDAPGETILIVDDNPTNTKLMYAVLEAEGYSVQSAVDADSAFAALASFRPRVILMDIQLPGVDGLEITRRLKADPKTRDILIIALTAYAMVGDKEKALQAGCDGYVSKPIDTRQFSKLLRGFLGEEKSDTP